MDAPPGLRARAEQHEHVEIVGISAGIMGISAGYVTCLSGWSRYLITDWFAGDLTPLTPAAADFLAAVKAGARCASIGLAQDEEMRR